MAISKQSAQLADGSNNPLIGSAQAAITSVATTSATNTTPYGYTTAAQADAIVTRINLILTALREHGLIKE